MAEAKVETEPATTGKVNEVCRQFLASADEGLAHRLQNEEYGLKYEWNRENRKVARVDVPLAKTVHDAEEERLQKERFDFLQKRTKLAEEDERMAHKLQQEERLNTEQEKQRIAERDAEVALQLQKEEKKKEGVGRIASDDAKLALEMQKEEILGKERDRIKLELEDQALARKFQEEERQLAEMRTMERDIREQRRLLELELIREAQMEEMMNREMQRSRFENSVILDRSQRPAANRDTVAILGGGLGGYRLSSTELMSDEERNELLKMQDEELAKALQEHEEKKAHRARREIAAEIEQRDAQLARILQDVERLELARRRNHVEGGTYIIFPVPHVEPVHSPHSAHFPGGNTRTNNVVDSRDFSHVSISSDNDTNSGLEADRRLQGGPPQYSVANRIRTQQSSTSSSDSARISSLTAASPSPQSSNLPPGASPPPPPPPPPLLTGRSSTLEPQYASVTRSRITETRVTTQPGTTYTADSRQNLNNRSVARSSSLIPAHHENIPAAEPKTRRQSSKDKSCKQQ